MVREAIILAGGFGTRLRAVVEDRPKSLAPINGRPFLEYLLDYLVRSGLERFVFSVGYRARQIEEHFGASYRGCPIRYALETEPLGTGGGILNALPLTTDETVLVTNGDSLFLADLAAQWKVHTECSAVATLALHPMRDFARYGRVEVAANGRVLAFREKEAVAEGLINGGVYLLQRDAFARAGLAGAFSLEKDFFGALVAELPFYGMPDAAYFLDIGIPEDFARAQTDFTAFEVG